MLVFLLYYLYLGLLISVFISSTALFNTSSNMIFTYIFIKAIHKVNFPKTKFMFTIFFIW